jgi:hypothetical protein
VKFINECVASGVDFQLELDVIVNCVEKSTVDTLLGIVGVAVHEMSASKAVFVLVMQIIFYSLFIKISAKSRMRYASYLNC